MGFGEVGPTTFVVEAGERADGANNGGGSDLHVAPLLDKLFDDPADVLAAGLVEGGGAGVAVESLGVELEVFGDEFDGIPAEVSLFNGVEVRAAADPAFAAVAFEAGEGGDAFGDFGLSGAAERAACRRGRGMLGGVVCGGVGGALFGSGFGLGAGLGFADVSGLGGDGRKALSGKLGVAVGAAFGEDFVEAVIEDDFGVGGFRHRCLSPLR